MRGPGDPHSQSITGLGGLLEAQQVEEAGWGRRVMVPTASERRLVLPLENWGVQGAQ